MVLDESSKSRKICILIISHHYCTATKIRQRKKILFVHESLSIHAKWPGVKRNAHYSANTVFCGLPNAKNHPLAPAYGLEYELLDYNAENIYKFGLRLSWMEPRSKSHTYQAMCVKLIIQTMNLSCLFLP